MRYQVCWQAVHHNPEDFVVTGFGQVRSDLEVEAESLEEAMQAAKSEVGRILKEDQDEEQARYDRSFPPRDAGQRCSTILTITDEAGERHFFASPQRMRPPDSLADNPLPLPDFEQKMVCGECHAELERSDRKVDGEVGEFYALTCPECRKTFFVSLKT